MNLIRKGHGHAHRGIIGVESAIVLIAFVIVAAALAFVVLNMGFATTQKAKTTIISSLGESSSSLEVSGKVMAVGCTICNPTNPQINATGVPIKIISGGESVDLDPVSTSIKYLSNSVEYTNIYAGTLNDTTYQSMDAAFDAAANPAGIYTYIDSDPWDNDIVPYNANAPTNTRAFIFWSTTNTPQNSILDQGEHATIVIAFNANDKPTALDRMRAEVIVGTGASLTVERQVPTVSYSIVDLG